ncbi:MAG: serine hydrolase [Burkholderiales bacterium]|nr:serine hydrolase [Burkholderiales bacterium]
MSAARTPPDDTATAISALLRERFPDDAPGVAVGVLRAGQPLALGRGLARLASGKEAALPFTPGSHFRACSITKQFVALLLLQFEAEGRLSLDDHPGRWVPALAGFDPALRLKHLAQNRSGLVDYWCAAMLTGALPESPFSRDDGERLIASLPRQMFAPGHGTRYNNGNWRILEWVLSAASGQPLAELLSTRIFAPLGMHDSRLGEDTSLTLPDGTTGYRQVDGRWEREITRIWWSGDAALVTTMNDLLKWEAAWLRRDPILTAAQDRLIEALPHGDGSPASYAFGLNAWSARGRRMHWHGGALRGWRMAQLRFPDDDTSVLVMQNRTANPVPLALDVAELLGLTPAWDRPRAAGSEVVGLPDPTGAWRCDAIDLVATFGEQGGLPTLSLGMDGSTLLRTGTDTLVSSDGFTQVEQMAEELIITSRNLGWRGRFRRLPFADARASLAGTCWHSAELGSAIRFTDDGKHLSITGPHGASEPYAVHAVAADHVAFDCVRALDEQPPGRYHLRRDGNELVAGCLLAQGFRFCRSA